jgi:hypothetical protein
MKRKRQRTSNPFVMVPLAILNTPAWQEMDVYAQALWIALRRKLSYDGSNNGKVYLACRPAAKAIGAHRNTIARKYAALEHYGFLRKTTKGCLGVEGHGIAPHWRFTDLAHGTHSATRDYEKWDGVLFVYAPKKKQNPVLLKRTPRPVKQDIVSPGNGSPLCPAKEDIVEAPRCPAKEDISRISISQSNQELQGGVSVSTPSPNKNGGAGSSPAPVSLVWLWRDGQWQQGAV